MTPPPSVELLLLHSHSLRGLVGALLRDEAATEDVLQETWLRALQSPPRGLERLGAWLRAVARSLALQRLRAERRRESREHHAARDEALPPTADVVARRTALREVVDAVLALDEPYQTVVLLRYFEDLPPREIGRRIGAPVATVKSRLRRGLEQLRERLDEEWSGDRQGWALGLASLTGITSPRAREIAATEVATVSSAGLFVMGFKTYALLAGAIVAALLTGWLWFPETRVPALAVAEEPADRASAKESPALLLSQDAPRTANEGGDREAATTSLEAKSPELPLHPGAAQHEFALEVHVTDAWDLPLERADVLLAPRLHEANLAGETEADGRLLVRWWGDSPEMTLGVQVRSAGGARSELRRVTLRAGELCRAAFALPAPDPQVGSGGETYFLSAARTSRGFTLHTSVGGELLELFEQAPPLAPLERGLPRFRSPVDDGAYLGFRALVESIFEFNAVSAYTLALQGTELPDPNKASVAGTIYDADGAPVKGVLVGIEKPSGALATRTETDDEGRFELRGLEPGELRVRAGGGSFGLARTTWTVEAGDAVTWDAQLDRGLELRGRLALDPPPDLREEWWIEARSASPEEAWADWARADENGAFAIPNCPAGPLFVRVWQKGLARAALPLHEEGPVYAGIGGAAIELALDREPLGNLRVALQHPDGSPIQGVEARLWSATEAIGTWLREQEGLHLCKDLPAGSYSLELGSAERGWMEVGPVHLAAGEDLDLGAVMLPKPGFVEVAFERPRDDWLEFDLCIVREREDSDSIVFEGTAQIMIEDYPIFVEDALDVSKEDLPALALPAGSYELLVRGDRLAATSHPFTVHQDRTTTVRVDFENLRRLDVEVLLPSGVPAADAADAGLALIDAATGNLLLHERIPRRGDDASFEWSLRLAEGRYVLRAVVGPWSAEAVVEPSWSPTEPVRLRVH